MTGNDHFQYLAWRRKRRILLAVIGIPCLAVAWAIANQFASQDWMKHAHISDIAAVATKKDADPEVQFQYAYRLMADQQSREAMEVMKGVVKSNDRNPLYWFGLGRSASGCGEAVLAEDAMRHAITLKPDMTEARVSLASLLASAGLVSEAITEFENVMQRRGDLKTAHIAYAKCLIAVSRFEDAWKELKAYTDIDRMNLEIYPLIMIAGEHTGHDDEASELVLNRIKSTIQYPLPELRTLMIEHEMRQNRSKDTLKAGLSIAEDVARAGQSGAVYTLLARMRLLNGDAAGAVKALDKIHENERNTDKVLDLRAHALRKLGKNEEAKKYENELVKLRAPSERIAKLRAAVDASPEDANRRLELVKELKGQARYGDAVEACRVILAKHPENADAKTLHDECRKLALENLEETSKKIVEQEDRFKW